VPVSLEVVVLEVSLVVVPPVPPVLPPLLPPLAVAEVVDEPPAGWFPEEPQAAASRRARAVK
jgi:hypothetical protein